MFFFFTVCASVPIVPHDCLHTMNASFAPLMPAPSSCTQFIHYEFERTTHGNLMHLCLLLFVYPLCVRIFRCTRGVGRMHTKSHTSHTGPIHIVWNFFFSTVFLFTWQYFGAFVRLCVAADTSRICKHNDAIQRSDSNCSTHTAAHLPPWHRHTVST